MIRKKAFLTCLLLGITACSSLIGCRDQGTANTTTEAGSGSVVIQALPDLVGKRVGFLKGGMFQSVLESVQPGIAEYKPYNYTQLMVQALRKGKIDAVLEDEPIALLWSAYYPEELHLAFTYADDYYSFATRKGDPLNARISEVIKQLESSGELEKFKTKWCKSIDQNRRITKWSHKKDYDGSAGVIRYATDPSQVPMAYQAYNELMGMDIEVLNRVAYELNMKVEYTKMNFAELLDALQNGKADLVGGCLSVTPERQQKVDFVHPYYKGGMAVLSRINRKQTDAAPAAP